MVRQLIRRAMAGALCAAMLAALCAATPRPAYADDPKQEPVDLSGIEERLTTIDTDININDSRQQDKLDSIDKTLVSIQDELAPPEGKTEVDYLSSIEDKLSAIAGNTAEETIAEQKSVITRANSLQFVAYANATTSGTYYNYASGYLQQMEWDDVYVFLQDTSSSYVLAFGDLSQVDGSTISGNMIKWVRWYYSNNTVGYVMETGQSDITITTNNHVVLSNLPKWPAMLSANDETLRREVGFYALVTLACSILRDVWSFLVRMRTASFSLDCKG